jgi:uncharacterized membrane protein
MRLCVFLCWFLVIACADEAKEKTVTANTSDVSNSIPPSPLPEMRDTSINFANDTASHPSYASIKKPSGIYQFLFPYDATTKILHTIAFYPNTFRLQEEYVGKKDSVVITEGTWAPSQGFIWLYQGHIARGRYTWKGDTLQYFSPRLNKKFSLTKQIPASANKIWMDKKAGGTIVFGVGTEPFWSVEVNKRDSIILSMPEWTQPLRLKISDRANEKDKMVYTAIADSLQVIVHPHFCSDGMSDFTYSNKVTVRYKGKTYQGCGMTF